MRSRTSCFNPAIYRKNLLRFWPVWLCYLIVWLLILPTAISPEAAEEPFYCANRILESALNIGAPVTAGFACASAMAVFSFLYSAKSACMVAGLPLRREAVYFTSFLSGLTWLFGVPLIAFLAGLVTSAATGVAVSGALFAWLGVICLESLLFYGFACFCAMLTGHLVVLPLVYVVLNFTVCAVEAMLRNLICIFVYGAEANGGLRLRFLSPLMLLIDMQPEAVYSSKGVLESVYVDCWWLLAVYAAAGLAFAVGGLLLYRRRQMESASDVVAVACLKPVFKYCLAGGCALVLGSLFYGLIFSPLFTYVGSAGWLLVCMLAGAFIGYFTAEMLMKKTFRVFGHAWKGYVILSFFLAALVLCAETDVMGYERRLPDASQVESVYLEVSNADARLAEQENIQDVLRLHQTLVNSKKKIENNLWNPIEHNVQEVLHCTIEYTLKDGTLLCRSYQVPYFDGDLQRPESPVSQADVLLNSQEARALRKQLELPVNTDNVDYAGIYWYDKAMESYRSMEMSREEAVEFYNSCILPDLEEGSLGRIWLVYDEDYYENVYDAQISIDLSHLRWDNRGEPEYTYDYFYTVPTRQSWRTNAWLKAKGINLTLEGELKELDSDMSDMVWEYAY